MVRCLVHEDCICRLKREELPSISILIGARNEEAVIANTVKSLLKAYYPSDKIQVIVVAHNCTDNTAKVASEAGAFVVESNIGRTKGAALNVGIEYATGSIIGVIDADTEVPVDFFITMMEDMIGYDAIQCEVRICNSGFLAHMTDVEFRMASRTIQEASGSKGAALLGGNGQFIKKEALDLVGRWTNSLADDTELSIRLFKAGYKIGFTNRTYVSQEAVTEFKPFVVQRVRWAAGNVSLVKDICTVKGLARVNGLFCIGSLLLTPFSMLSNILFISSCFFHNITTSFPLPLLIALLVAWPLTVITAMIKAKINPLNFLLYWIFLFYLNVVYVGVVKRLITKDTSWAKTSHGVKVSV